jgi:hypothetical protein
VSSKEVTLTAMYTPMQSIPHLFRDVNRNALSPFVDIWHYGKVLESKRKKKKLKERTTPPSKVRAFNGMSTLVDC